MVRLRHGALAIVALTLCAEGGVAHAQSVSERNSLNEEQNVGSNFRRDRSVSVEQRHHPEYDPVGIRAGSFLVYPKLGGSFQYLNNTFATPDDPLGSVSFILSPSVEISSDWARNSFEAYVRSNLSRNFNYSSEDFNGVSSGAKGQLDITATSYLTSSLDFAHAQVSRVSARSTANDLTSPIQYNVVAGSVGYVSEADRLRLAFAVNSRLYRYRNDTDPQGQLVIESDQDRYVVAFTGRADYAISPANSIFIETTANVRRYQIANYVYEAEPGLIKKDSHGVQILAGSNFDFTHLMRGEVAVGYLRQNYSEAAYPTITGPGVRARVLYFPTQIITVTATVTRTIEDSGLVNSNGVIAGYGQLQVDYELLRNLIISASGSLLSDKYRGISRIDHTTNAGLSATYRMNRRIGISASYQYADLTSKGTNAGTPAATNTISLTLTGQY
jgi:hypothetical protein